MQFNHELFKGISIQLKDVDTAEDLADQLASLPAVKNIWPVKLYDRPEFEKKWTDQDQARDKAVPESLIRKRQGESTALGNAPHVMTQVDKLHARGITGEGITIAVIDTGVSSHK
jgi:subtilisin family serine protease